MRLSRLRKNFDQLAAQDPLWTVLSDNEKRGGKWDPEELYQTGEDEIVDIESKLAHHGIKLGGASVLDFGCGVGRLSFPLSRRFDRCIGVDISREMIKAAKANSGRGKDCAFLLNTTADLSQFASDTFDCVYSDIVFQHMPNRYAKKYFKEIARTLAPGGYFCFQMPSGLDYEHAPNRRPFRMARKRFHYLTRSIGLAVGIGKQEPYFEMRSIPCDTLIRLLQRRCKLELRVAWEYRAAGPSWRSYFYAFKKGGPRSPA